LDGEIDLHGLSLDEAGRALRAFLDDAYRGGRRSLLVITGRGQRAADGVGRIREALPRWLNEPETRPLVVAYAPARPRHGGHGAFYVLLRKRR
jgi:DNA-nicking Smr family endonuclease